MKRLFGTLAICLELLTLTGYLDACQAQAVQQSGTVTPGHAVKWITNGVVGDGGSATNGLLSSLGVTASGPGICQQSALTGAFNRICLTATSTSGGIAMTNVGGATGGFTFTLNGTTQGIATVTLPVTVGDIACFSTTSGTLNDCGGRVRKLVSADGFTLNVNFALGSDTASCGEATGAGACKNIQYAINRFCNDYDIAGHSTPTVSIDDNDNYTSFTTCTMVGLARADNIRIVGNTTTPGNVKVSGGPVVQAINIGTDWHIRGMRLIPSGNQPGILCDVNSFIKYDHIEFAAPGTSSHDILMEYGCKVEGEGDNTILTGSRFSHVFGTWGSQYLCNPQFVATPNTCTMTLSGSPQFTGGYYYLTDSIFVTSTISYSGSAGASSPQIGCLGSSNLYAAGNLASIPGNASNTVGPLCTIDSLPAPATAARQMYQSGLNAVSFWSTATWPTTTVANQLLYSSGSNTVGGLTSANTAALVTSSAGVPSWTSGSTANQVLRTNGTTVSFAQVALATDVSGILSIANGGTGSSSGAIGCSQLPAGVNCNTLSSKTANYTLVTGDCGSTITLGGSAFYTLTVNAASGYSATCSITIANIDTGRGKLMSINGVTFPMGGILWPGQTFTLKNESNVWTLFNVPQRWKVTSAITITVNTAVGNDLNDGLAAGSGNAMATLQAAANRVCAHFDLTAQPSIQLTTAQTHPSFVECAYVSGGLAAGVTSPRIVGDATATATCTAASNNFTIDGAGSIAVTGVGVTTPWIFQGVKIQSTGNMAVEADFGSKIYLKNIRYGPSNFGAASFYQSLIEYIGGFCVSGNIAGALWSAQTTSLILIQPGNHIDITGAATTINIFAQSKLSGNIQAQSITFDNAANCTTGTKFTVDSGGGVDTNGGGAAYFPCPTAGTTAAPGWYQ